MLNVTALKRRENVASIINCADGRTQDRMWEALEGILTEEEVAGLKQYATLYHMFTDDSFFNEVQNLVGQMLAESLK